MEVQELFDTNKMTPAMRQYVELKAENPDAILFFRMGDFYEMFYEDAKIASRVLGITLTARDKEKSVPMCGIPFHAKDGYIPKLIKEGYKVALCEQMEKPGATKGVVKRAVVSVITPGIVHDENLLDSKSNNYISAVGKSNDKFGLASMDVTTGKFIVSNFDSIDNLLEEIRFISPSELVIDNILEDDFSFFEGNLSKLDSYDFKYNLCEERLLNHFKVASLDGFGLRGSKQSVIAAGVLLFYVYSTQKNDNLDHIQKITLYSKDENLILDYTTERNLDLVLNSRDGSRTGTLLSLMDKTMTPMGGRLLKNTIKAPLCNKIEIDNRLNAVEAFCDDVITVDNIKSHLDNIYDLERLISKISLRICGPRDLVSLKKSLIEIPKIKNIISTKISLSKVFMQSHENLDEVPKAIKLIDDAIKDEPPLLIRDGGFIKDGYNKELDELREIGSGGKDYIARLEAIEREKTGIPTLKVGFNKVFGYYIEVTKAKVKEMPSNYIRKQTLVNAERFITEELKEKESQILSAEERSHALEEEIYKDVVDRLSVEVSKLQNTAEAVALIDLISSFATLAEDFQYVKPVINDDSIIDIKQGRHPVIEEKEKGTFIPNDIMLDTNGDQVVILTGPNMAGKSTYIRQVALITIMAHMGSFVPAESAKICLVDRVFTRVGASDDINRGQSTFMVEMSETANILNNATDKSLVILDEIGRGTSTFDGLSIAWAVVEYLVDKKGSNAKTLFATHYHELTDLALTKGSVKNYNMSVKEFEGSVVFLKKVVPGGANRSYGIQVAKLAGLPLSIISRAFEILHNLEDGELNEEGMPSLSTGGNSKSEIKVVNDTDKNYFNNVLDDFKKLDLNSMSPIQALNVLSDIKNKIKGK